MLSFTADMYSIPCVGLTSRNILEECSSSSEIRERFMKSVNLVPRILSLHGQRVVAGETLG